MTLELIDRLAENFDQAGISYCHWKSNFALAEGLAGHLDLDLLVDRGALPAALVILARLGFKSAVPQSGNTPAGIQHFYGLDAATGSLVHVHLFNRVLTGESFVKSHALPLEKMLLEDTTLIEQIRVPSRTAELVLFILRTFIKYGSPLDLVYLARSSDQVRAELDWLLQGADLPRSLHVLQLYCPVVEQDLFIRCVEALQTDISLFQRFWLAAKVRNRLRPYAVRNALSSAAAYVRLLWEYASRRLARRRTNKVLTAGGALIAFVGPEATGKSTLVEETARWLRPFFPVVTIHAGKPPSSWLTAPVNLMLPWVRSLWPRLRTSRLEGHVSSEADAQPLEEIGGFSGLIYAIRSVTLAWDRRQLLVSATRRAARGDIVICDRYPSETTGAMDSPRLQLDRMGSGMGGGVLAWLARLEQGLYAQIPPPDVVIKLNVTVETAKIRNRERIKTGKESDAYLESRHRQVRAWSKPGTRGIYEIDTEQPLEATLRCARELIWEAL